MPRSWGQGRPILQVRPWDNDGAIGARPQRGRATHRIMPEPGSGAAGRTLRIAGARPQRGGGTGLRRAEGPSRDGGPHTQKDRQPGSSFLRASPVPLRSAVSPRPTQARPRDRLARRPAQAAISREQASGPTRTTYPHTTARPDHRVSVENHSDLPALG